MKIFLVLSSIFLSVNVFASFDFGTCAGSGSFEQEILQYDGDYENTVIVGDIPEGIQGLRIELISEKDVDIRLYAKNNNDKIVHWPHGILKSSSQEIKPYLGANITYSGYNGVNGSKGHEFIEVSASTPTEFTMKAFGYKSGYAKVNYSWSGKDNCIPEEKGHGSFDQPIAEDATAFVGTIPSGIKMLDINLTSHNDIDIQLYGEDGTAIASWKPEGLISGPMKQTVSYHGMQIEWSGYGGVNGESGHEYIKVTPKTTEILTMKVYGYEAGNADVQYRWGESIGNTTLKPIPSGLVMRGKTKNSYCEPPRGEMDGGYCQIAWSDLEPNKNTYDFTLIDDAISKAKAYNMERNLSDKDGYKVLIRIRTGIYSPAWVSDEAGSVDWYFRNSNDQYALPIFWEMPFQNLYKGLMQKLAERYDNNPTIGLVAASMCMTKHTEIMWNRTGRNEVNALNMQSLRSATNIDGTSAQYTNEKDYQCLENQVNIHNDTWKRTSTIFGSHLYQQYDYNNGSHRPIYNTAVQLFDYCTNILGTRCIIGNNSLLHTENNTDMNINRAISDLASKKYATYYQTHVFKDEGSKPFDFDNLKTALNHAANWGAVFVELPMGWDCISGTETTTRDKTTCDDAVYKSTLLQSYRRAIQTNIQNVKK